MLPGHLLGATGAGDVKLMAAAGALLGPALVLSAFIFAALAGGVLAVAVAVHRQRLAATFDRHRPPRRGRRRGPRRHPHRRRVAAIRLRPGNRHRLRTGRVHWLEKAFEKDPSMRNRIFAVLAIAILAGGGLAYGTYNLVNNQPQPPGRRQDPAGRRRRVRSRSSAPS